MEDKDIINTDLEKQKLDVTPYQVYKSKQETKSKNRIQGYKNGVVVCLVFFMVGLILLIYGSYYYTGYNLIFSSQIIMAVTGIFALIYAFLYFTSTRKE